MRQSEEQKDKIAYTGKYCKAYLLRDLRAFGAWTEQLNNARTEIKEENGQEIEITRQLTDDAVLYLHENYVVTDGIFQDENVIFDNVTSEWVEYCQETLKFKKPENESVT